MIESFTKTINPAFCTVDDTSKRHRAFARIEYKDGNLSICGVIGPMKNGNACGDAGQCYDEIETGTPAEHWTDDMLKKFIEVWKRWHLNNMQAGCEHQRNLGWDNEASQQITVHHYQITDEARKKKIAVEKAALEALRNGKTFTPSTEQTLFAALPNYCTSFENELDLPYYKPYRTETKTRRTISYDEDPVGILGKPCPVCGYKYGSSWCREEVPQDVVDFLFNLPETAVTPAWV